MLALELPVCAVYMHIAITVYMHVYKYHSKLLVTLLNISFVITTMVSVLPFVTGRN